MSEGGRIVLTSSASAHKAVFYHALYASSKAAVESIALNLSPELLTKITRPLPRSVILGA
ncbi:SDR family NAD(P)-dependent oxidoreductase [Streptomyces yaanensis]|uniref:SDR family NAD(P)-dependent oxidoreductase n=1 Tax=Streptomyces yaanensis TaxID=1142239 RepID=A0ABV7SB02_9ACTN